MFCKNCGQQLQDDSAFCFRCGAKIAPPATVASPQTATPAKKSVNGFGIAAFAIGIITVILGIYLFIFSIAGIVLGAVGVARRKNYSSNWLAITGLVLSCVAFVFWAVVWCVVLYHAMLGLFLLFFLPFTGA